jgi:hypothetical protein
MRCLFGIRLLAVAVQIIIVTAIMAGCLAVANIYTSHDMPQPRLVSALIRAIPVVYLFVLVWLTRDSRTSQR